MLKGVFVVSLLFVGCASGPKNRHLSPDAESATLSAWNTGKTDALDTVLHEELVFSVNGCLKEGRAGYKDQLEKVRGAYTGFRLRQLGRYVDGDTVIAQWHWKNSTGEKEEEAVSISRFEEGRIVESHFFFDEEDKEEGQRPCPKPE